MENRKSICAHCHHQPHDKPSFWDWACCSTQAEREFVRIDYVSGYRVYSAEELTAPSHSLLYNGESYDKRPLCRVINENGDCPFFRPIDGIAPIKEEKEIPIKGEPTFSDLLSLVGRWLREGLDRNTPVRIFRREGGHYHEEIIGEISIDDQSMYICIVPEAEDNATTYR